MFTLERNPSAPTRAGRAKAVPQIGDHDVLAVSDRMAMILRGEDTGDEFALIHCITAPEEGPPLHIHQTEDETFHVLKGEYDFQVGDTLMRVSPGGTVFGARGVPHAYRNPGKTPAEMLLLVTPAGFERFFERVSGLTASNEINPQVLTEEAAKYGCAIVGPPLV